MRCLDSEQLYPYGHWKLVLRSELDKLPLERWHSCPKGVWIQGLQSPKSLQTHHCASSMLAMHGSYRILWAFLVNRRTYITRALRGRQWPCRFSAWLRRFLCLGGRLWQVWIGVDGCNMLQYLMPFLVCIVVYISIPPFGQSIIQKFIVNSQ